MNMMAPVFLDFDDLLQALLEVAVDSGKCWREASPCQEWEKTVELSRTRQSPDDAVAGEPFRDRGLADADHRHERIVLLERRAQDLIVREISASKHQYRSALAALSLRLTQYASRASVSWFRRWFPWST